MRILLVHSDFLEFEVKEKTPVAEEIPEDRRKGRLEEVLVVFAAVEEEDGGDVRAVAENAAGEISRVASEVRAERIAIYPYAHLSPSLAPPRVAV
ncbi:MAG: threonyl-tRNA synthetase editing domain-containing protein, partial [Candidatus Hadarchaeales archaeon]